MENLSLSPRPLEVPFTPLKPKLPQKRPRPSELQADSRTLFAQPSGHKLDSVALQWKLGNSKLLSLPAKRLLEVFDEETTRFRSYSLKACTKLAGRLRKAFELIGTEPVKLASVKSCDAPATCETNDF